MSTSSDGASGGGSIVAWATKRGLELLFADTKFCGFIQQSPFLLIVGMDSITDESAIQLLEELAAEYQNLSVFAFVHDQRWLFHPKLSWFDHGPNEITVLVGSGNMTGWGLRSNWEATGELRLRDADAAEVREQIQSWISAHQSQLLDLDDDLVAERAKYNSGSEREIKQPRPRVPATPTVRDEEEFDTWLVTELAKSRKNAAGQSLFSQASFPRDVFEEFFRYTPGGMDLQLHQVHTSQSSLGPLESRRGRYKPNSINYYFELGAASGIPFPDDGAPIALFCRLVTGEFLYVLSLPSEDGYDELKEMLQAESNTPAKGLQRAMVTSEIVEQYWPGCPILTARTPDS